MKWTTDKPTRPGVYWYHGPIWSRDFKTTNPNNWWVTVAEVKGNRVTFMLSTVTRYLHRTEQMLPAEHIIPDNARWCGPIEEPE